MEYTEVPLTGCLRGNALEDVVDKRVENGHRLVGDTSIRVDLLEDCESASDKDFARTTRLQYSPL